MVRPGAVRLARHTLATIRVDLVRAFGYHVVPVPLAMLDLLNPMMTAADSTPPPGIPT